MIQRKMWLWLWLVAVAVAVAVVMIAGVCQCRFNVGFPTHDNSLVLLESERNRAVALSMTTKMAAALVDDKHDGGGNDGQNIGNNDNGGIGMGCGGVSGASCGSHQRSHRSQLWQLPPCSSGDSQCCDWQKWRQCGNGNAETAMR